MRGADASAIDWVERLVGYDTTSAKSNLGLIEDIQAYLNDLGITSRLTYDDSGKKANLWATIGPEDRGGVVLSGHTDVVPVDGQDWSTDPFKMHRDDKRLYGRGTADMKSFIAIAMSYAEEMTKRNLKTPLHFAFSYDEEVGCGGVKGLISDIEANLPTPRAVIVGEPTEMQIIGGHKGGRLMRTDVTGVAGHSSEPDLGANAIMAAARIVSFIEDLQAEMKASADPNNGFEPPYTTIGIGLINGGTASNIIAEHCSIDWEYRALPQDDANIIEAKVRDFIAENIDPALKAAAPHAGAVTTQIIDVPPLMPDENSPAEQLLRHLTGLNQSGVVSFGTEAGHFQNAGIPGVIFGPGSIQQAHKPDEFIDISQISACVDFMGKLIDWAETEG